MDWAYAFSDDASFEPVFGADAVFDAEEPGFCEPGREHDDSDIIPQHRPTVIAAEAIMCSMLVLFIAPSTIGFFVFRALPTNRKVKLIRIILLITLAATPTGIALQCQSATWW
ncbi:hypothetical protein [Bifidobacterium porcinum]|uniref:hypothetical protein n=1 Tax=Bifidobacterium porcinum TaxID=212365 RepID=UPI001364306E|nr:hypothetical protein [Bifidobacterium porcinum]